MSINKKKENHILNIILNTYIHPAKVGLSLTGFTLIELIIVIIIIGVLASVAVPMYMRSVEEARGKACQNNMRVVLSAWRIYNLKYDDWDPGGSFNTVSQINTKLGTVIDERYFGQDGATSNYGFDMDLDTTGNNLRLRTYRQTGQYSGKRISCFYYYNNGTYDWNPASKAWGTTWPLTLSE